MWIIGMASLKARLYIEVISMGLAFIEQVELLCELHVQQASESGKDNCVLMMLIMAKNARQELTESLVHVEVANDALMTSR
jgi:hypothetical protein